MKEKLEKVSNYLKANLRVKVLMGALILGLVITALGYTYALFTVQVEKKNAFTIIVTNLNYTLESSALNDQKQITVESGGKQTFDITVTNPNEKESHFKLFYLGTTDENVVVSYTPNEVYPEGLGTLPANGSTTFTITIENNTSSSVTITLGCQGGLKDRELTLKQGKELVEVSGEAPTYVDSSGANAPILTQGQISVVYNPWINSWVKADLNKSYDYSTQNWANAVTVTEANRETYMNAEIGTPIPMDDINTMWVWIPRYEYMYTNLGENYAGGTQTEPGEIKINFLNEKSTTSSDSNNYKVHPAFTFGTDELEGFWYGKFETGGTLTTPCTNTSCDTSAIVIKPGVMTFQNQKLSSFFYTARSMQLNNTSTFGFSKTNSDLHMSKNSEWGAVAYLSQSKYGKFGNAKYEKTEKEVMSNGDNDGLTGGGSGDSYVTNIAQSTTGNISGVYDMSGGAYEHVMGVLADPSGNPRCGLYTAYNSGFNGMLSDGSMYTEGLPLPDSKYYNLYTSSNPTSTKGTLTETACNGGICYGHALSETGEWYRDNYYHLSSTGPWFVRGYIGSSTSAGVFAASGSDGSAYDNFSTRFVLSCLGK